MAILDAAMDGPVTPLAFSTTAVTEIRRRAAPVALPADRLLRPAHDAGSRRSSDTQGQRVAARLHGVGDIKRYNARMAAVEYAIEHDDGQSMRALDKADVILIAPSRCGKTPTTMYLALQHGIFVANYPLVEEDLDTNELPKPIRHLRDRCFGITTTAARLSQVRHERRAELPVRLAGAVHASSCVGPRRSTASTRSRSIDSSAKSVEEMSTVILQSLAQPRLTSTRPRRPRPTREDPRMTTATPTSAGPPPTTSAGSPSSGLADLEQVGGKNSSLGEMVGQPDARPGCGCPTASPPPPTPTAASSATPGWPSGSTRSSPTSTPTTSDELAEVGQGDPDGGRRAAVPGRPGGRHPRGVRAAGRGRRGGRPSRSAPVATAEDLPDASFAGQQETFLNVRGIDAVLTADPRGVRLALQRPGDRLPGAPRASTHDDGRRCRPACSGWCAPTSAPPASCSPWTPSPASTTRCSSPPRTGWARRVVQGAVNPDEFYVYKPALRAGRPAILKRGVGGKATKMVYTDDADGRADHRVRRRRAEAERGLLSLTDDEVDGAGPARAGHRGALRPADGHRVGQGRCRRRSLHPAGAAGDGAVAAPGAHGAAVPAERARVRCWSRAGRSARRSAPAPVRVLSSVDADARASCPARCWSPT